MDSLVTIIIPTYNRLALLARSVQSVLNQSYKNFELLIVDDASSDGTADYLAEAQRADSRVRVLRNAFNGGAANARNRGIQEARGQYVAFHDDDDVWFADRLLRSVECLVANPELHWAICAFIRLSSSSAEYIGGDFYYQELRFADGLGPATGANWRLIATPSWLVKRELLLELGGFDEQLSTWEDWELGLRIYLAAGAPGFVDQPLWLQDLARGGGLSRLYHRRALGMIHLMDVHADYWANQEAVQAANWYYVGRQLSLSESGAKGRYFLLKSFRIQGFSLHLLMAFLASWLPASVNQKLTGWVRETRWRWRMRLGRLVQI